MLADFPNTLTWSGSLGSDIHLPATSRHAVLNFIKDQLPHWRDRTDRKDESSETVLTSHLCAHLNSAARLSGWDFLQFQTEVPDETSKGRAIDLTPMPCASVIYIEGRRHADFEPIFPIECKRLPTPKGKGRDEQEYVINRHKSTGGIQRFKAGHHGAAHTFGAMIAYVQEQTALIWDKRVAKWIKGLVKAKQPNWTKNDLLSLEINDKTQRIAVLRSSHTRDNGLQDIELYHLWLKMN